MFYQWRRSGRESSLDPDKMTEPRGPTIDADRNRGFSRMAQSQFSDPNHANLYYGLIYVAQDFGTSAARW
jgi:hypothetical protein